MSECGGDWSPGHRHVSKKAHTGSCRDGVGARRSAPQGAAERKEAQTLRWQPSKIAQHESLPQHPFLGFVGSWLNYSLPSLTINFIFGVLSVLSHFSATDNQLEWGKWQGYLIDDRGQEHITHYSFHPQHGRSLISTERNSDSEGRERDLNE